MARKTFYLYAGYYELFLSDRPLRCPLTLQSKHKSIGGAVRKAESYDDTIHADERLAPDLHDYYGDYIPIHMMKLDKYSIERGYTAYTGMHFRLCPDAKPVGQDWNDLMQWIAHLTGTDVRKAVSLHGEKTYGELRSVLHDIRKPKSPRHALA